MSVLVGKEAGPRESQRPRAPGRVSRQHPPPVYGHLDAEELEPPVTQEDQEDNRGEGWLCSSGRTLNATFITLELSVLTGIVKTYLKPYRGLP